MFLTKILAFWLNWMFLNFLGEDLGVPINYGIVHLLDAKFGFLLYLEGKIAIAEALAGHLVKNDFRLLDIVFLTVEVLEQV